MAIARLARRRGAAVLYLNTIRALLPLVVVWLGLDRLWRRWRRRETDPGGWTVRSTWGWGLTTFVALAWAPEALRVLFPASPTADGWDAVIGLSFNIAIALAPFTLWWTYRTLFPPAGRVPAKGWARVFLWPALLLSSLLAPLLLWGPPNLLLFLLPADDAAEHRRVVSGCGRRPRRRT